jgi:VirK protein
MLSKFIHAAPYLLGIAGVVAVVPHYSSASGSPAQPGTYSQVHDALTAGKRMSITVRFDHCNDVATSMRGPPVAGGALINGFLAHDADSIAFANVHETLDEENKPLTEYIRYRVGARGGVEIRATMVETRSGQLRREVVYDCPIGQAAMFHVLNP